MEFPSHATNVDWLFDESFGTGVWPDQFPLVRFDHPLCGLSGRINPDNVRTMIEHKFDVWPGRAYWIDIESGVRLGREFDLKLCETVCRAKWSNVGGKPNW